MNKSKHRYTMIDINDDNSTNNKIHKIKETDLKSKTMFLKDKSVQNLHIQNRDTII